MSEIDVTAEQLNKALLEQRKPTVTVEGITVQDLRLIGKRYWFEYHCNESHDSPDAPVWYRSHQQCEVLRVADCDGAFFDTFKDRGEMGHQILYRVKFDDGLEWDVFEDELLDSIDEFQRPAPPQPVEIK